MIPSPDGRPVPEVLPRAIDYTVIKILKYLHRALEESRETSSSPNHDLMEWYRLVGYAMSDGYRYHQLALGVMAAHMQSLGLSPEAVSRYLQVPQGQVPDLITQDAREMVCGLIDSPDPRLHTSIWFNTGQSIATADQDTRFRDRAEALLVALFHNPEDDQALDYLPPHLQDMVQAITRALDEAPAPA